VLSAAAVAVRGVLGVAVVLIAVGAITMARLGLFDIYTAVGAVNPAISSLTADQLKAGAADSLEAATGKGGGGFAFEIVQTSTIKAQPGGPLIDIPDPANGRVIIGQASEYPYYTLLEHGVVTPAGFWSELRSWPVAAGAPIWDKADLRRSALLRDGVSWRNDRQGWYEADVLPGIGLDPATAALLPTLLRDASGAQKEADVVVGGVPQLRVDAAAQKTDMPGVVAADGVAYTKINAPVEFSFDGQGRLVAIHVVALNTNLKGYDLAVDTVITIRYDDVGNLPAPDPTFDASKTGEAAQ
jgi:hypothetical protein